jgi:amino acid adenylation domain-containing protein
MTLFAAFGVLLHRYTGQDRILVGVPVANRNRMETERMIGLFVNTLPFAADLTGDPTFREVLHRARSTTFGGFAHQDVPFTKIVEALKPARDASRGPIVQVMFAYQSTLPVQREANGVTVTRLPVETGTSKFELTLELEPHGAALAGWVEYNTDLFDAATIARFVRHFELLVDALVADPAARIADVPFLLPAERQQLLVEWNATGRDFRDQRLDELFEAQVERTPDAIAVRFEDAQLSYRELDARANQYAHRLRSLGVGPDVLVPLFVDRSLELLAAILGILKAGGAYVPLDPEYPADRLAVMLADCAPPVIVSEARLAGRLPPGTWRIVDLDAGLDTPRGRLARTGTPADLAYGIYTSGSTGIPKCALVTHRGVANLLSWMQETYRLDETDRVLHKSPLVFDASIRELFWPLVAGARVVVARPDGHKDVGYVLDVIRAEQITTINFVPSLLELFVEEPALAECTSLKRVISGGEALADDVRVRFYARSSAALYNHYGPTETTVTSVFWPCPRETTDRTLPIGRPIANTRLYVLDGKQQPVPVGVPGELYIGGAGLARGYLNRPELTAERFVLDPFTPGDRLYRTGDIVRYRADGALEYLGRTDHQVKLRGFRIELGEIEAALREHPAIRDSVVLVREDVPGQKHLVAYVVGTPELDALRLLMQARLPEYMIPSSVVVLDAMPLMVNGKVDRKALPAPTRAASTEARVAPRNPTEERIAAIWREVLGVEQLGVRDDFFELGGHSLLAMQVVARIRKTLVGDIPPRILLQAKTIEDQARQLARQDRPIELAITRSDDPVARATIAQEQFWYLSQEDPDPTAYFISNVFVLDGPLERELLERSYCELVAYHSIFRTTFREIDGLLHQIIPPNPVAPPGLELEQRLDLPEERLEDEIKRIVGELMLVPCDLATGLGIIRGRLVALGPARHVLVFLVHHIASDGAAFTKQLFDGYAQLRAGQPSAVPNDRPFQYIDFAHARARFGETPAGKAQRAYWLDQVRGAQPLELPFDFPREPLDARRDSLPFGISPDLNHPPEYFKLPAGARAAVIAAARTQKTTPYMIYLGALAWLFHQLSGQDEVSIQTTYNNRPEYPALEQVQGPLAWWTHLRIDTSGKPSFGELVRRTSLVVERARQNGVVEDYFQLVPHRVRRSTFNYLALAEIPTEERIADLLIARKRQPFPRWKRHWDLHLTLMDFANDTMLVWTGTMRLYRHETVKALLQRYVDVLARAAD